MRKPEGMHKTEGMRKPEGMHKTEGDAQAGKAEQKQGKRTSLKSRGDAQAWQEGAKAGGCIKKKFTAEGEGQV